MTDPTHERLASGAARLVGDDLADAYEARIVPIPEDERTTGLSGEDTIWPRETLKEATERGAWDGVKLLKSPGGSGHFDWGEQPPVENLAGSIIGSHYEDEVGPVLEAELVDEQLARLVEHDLVSVSPDLTRELGEADEQLGAKPAERIGEVRYITVLDVPASENASIQPATADALGMHPDQLGGPETDTEHHTRMPPSTEAEDASHEQLAQLQYLRFWPDPVPEGDEEPLDAFDAAADAVDAIEGVTAVLNTETDSDGTVRDAELLAVLHSDRADLGTLNNDLMSALDETPFEAGSGYDWVPELETEYLARRDETREHSDQPMGADSDPSEPADIDPSTMGDDTTKEELREQLAAAEAQNEEYEDRIDDLEGENETLESEIESEREQRKEDTEHLRRRYAEAATTSEMAAEALVDNDDKSVEDLAEMALEAQEDDEPENEADEGGGDDEEQLSAMERYEQLAAENPNPRGGGGEDDPGGGNGQLDEEQTAKAEQLSRTVMSGDDVMTASEEQLSGREFVRQHKGVDPSEFDSETALKSAIERENGGEA